MKNAYLFFLGLLFHSALQAQMPGWNHIQPISIQENSGAEVTAYQLALTVNTATPIAAGEMLADGSDIRFTSECSGGILFNYWIETGINTASTKIWVKVDTLHANSLRIIYMQYGNAAATTVSAVSGTFFGPHSSTDSVASGGAGGVGNSQRGFRFSANEDVLVTSFGKREPTGTTRYVTLFDFTTQAILGQIQVAGPAGQYSYGNLASPMWLTQGTQYVIELYQDVSDGYYFGSSSQIGQHLTYYDMRYCNSCTQNTFPTNTLSNYHYGYPDLWYFTKSNISPAPTYSFISQTIGFSADSTAICLNDSIQLQSSVIGGQPPFTYNWTNNAINDPSLPSPYVSPATSTVYYLTVTDGCGVAVTDSVEVTVNPLPSFSLDASPTLICNGESSVLTVSGNYTYTWQDGGTDLDTVVSPSVTTTYSVTAMDSLSCTLTQTVDVNVNVPLTATHNVSICANDSYTVGSHTYTDAGTYVDTLAGITSCDSIVTTVLSVDPLPTGIQTVNLCFGESLTIGAHVYSVDGTYVDTLSNAVGCDSIMTTILTIDPEVNAEVHQLGTFLVADDQGANGYQWFDCTNNIPISGETQSTFEVIQNGSYACIVTVNGCSNVGACVTVDDLSVNEPSVISSLTVYPNPAKGEVKVFSGIDQEITFIDATGKALKTVQLKEKETATVSLSGFATGVYFIRHGQQVTRLIVD